MFALNKAGKFLVALLHSDEMKGENNRWLLDGDGDAIDQMEAKALTNGRHADGPLVSW